MRGAGLLLGLIASGQEPGAGDAARPAPVPAPVLGGGLESLEREIVRVVERVRPCVATLDIDRTFPLPPVSLSAFLIDRETLVTTGAALEGAHRISVRFPEGPSLRGEFLGRGPGNRVGLIRVAAGGLPDPPLAGSSPLRLGAFVVGIGSPYGFQGSVFVGWLSGAERTLGGLSGLLQTTVPVNRGNAGGALANVRGEIVGMLVGPYEESRVLTLRIPSLDPGKAGAVAPALPSVRDKEVRDEDQGGEEAAPRPVPEVRFLARAEQVSATVPSEGIHFAMPIASVREEARSVLERLGRPASPRENRRWLGVYLEPAIDPALRAHLGIEEGRGLLVREVYQGSPAARAGLEPHDVLLALDGVPLEAAAEGLRLRLDGKAPGARVEFEVLRRGARVRVAAALE